MASKRRRLRLPESPWVPILGLAIVIVVMFAIALIGYLGGGGK
jgi:hypothetical protein